MNPMRAALDAVPEAALHAREEHLLPKLTIEQQRVRVSNHVPHIWQTGGGRPARTPGNSRSRWSLSHSPARMVKAAVRK